MDIIYIVISYLIIAALFATAAFMKDVKCCTFWNNLIISIGFGLLFPLAIVCKFLYGK